MYKLSLEAGKTQAAESLGLPEAAPSTLSRLAPYLAAAATIPAAYAYHRLPKFSTNPEVAALQRASKGKLTLIDALPKGQAESTGLKKLYKRLVRGADDIIEQPYETWQRKPPKVRKGIEGAMLAEGNPEQSLHFKPSIDVGENLKDIMHFDESKLHEAAFFQQHAPGAMPATESIAKYTEGLKGTRDQKLKTLHARLLKAYPEGFAVKPVAGWDTGGVLSHELPFKDVLENPANSPKFKAQVRDLLVNPEDHLVQKYIDIGELSEGVPKEYRVHAVGGHVVPGGNSARYGGIWQSINPFGTAHRETAEAERFFQEQLSKLPRERLEGMPMAADIAKDTSGNWHIIETNPGGQSGFLTPDITGVPSMSGHALYKHVTGRDSQTMAGAKALGTGLGVGVGTAGIQHGMNTASSKTTGGGQLQPPPEVATSSPVPRPTPPPGMPSTRMG